MESSSKYRAGALTLVGIFFIFNVGLPIVLSSCPMLRAKPVTMCPVCCSKPVTGQVSLSTPIDRSCCATVILADRNKTDYVQERPSLDNQNSSNILIAVNPLEVASTSTPSSSFVWCESSVPPAYRDISIFNSLLLI